MKVKIFFLISLPIFLLPLGVQGQTLNCTESEDEAGRTLRICDVIDGMEKPSNCELDRSGANKIVCTGEPVGYTCGRGASFTCEPLPSICTSSSGGYDCVLPTNGVLPSGCISFGGGMRCSQLPAGYSIEDSPSVSPTSVTPGGVYTTPRNTTGGNLSYTPLEPFPGELGEAQSGTGNFKDLLEGFFKLLINVGAFVAVTVLVIGGITYMVSEATLNKFMAKERIKAAFWGLAIIAGAWLLLNTINPQLLMFDQNLIEPSSPTSNSQGGPNSGNAPTTEITITSAGGITVHHSLPLAQKQAAIENFVSGCRDGKIEQNTGSDSLGLYTEFRCVSKTNIK